MSFLIRRIPHTYTIVFSLIIISAIATWIIPAGEFARETVQVGSTERTVIVNNSFQYVDQAPQTWQIFTALLRGFESQAGIIAFILIIGGAFWIMNATQSINVGIFAFLGKLQGLERFTLLRRIGVNNIVISLVMIMFSLFGAVFGMSEETLAFVVIIVPLAISMGYDSITGVCMVYVAAHVGFAGAMLNPFTIGIAQGLSHIPIFSGFEYRLVCWCVLTTIIIAFVLFYASKIKKNPHKSPSYKIDEYWRNNAVSNTSTLSNSQRKTSSIVVSSVLAIILSVFAYFYTSTTISIGEAELTAPFLPILALLFIIIAFISNLKSYHFSILNILFFTILYLIVGVMGYGWYIEEISALFLVMGIAAGFSAGNDMSDNFRLFVEGCKDIFSAAMIVGFAGGIIIILQDGKIIDSILNTLAQSMSELGRIGAVGVMYVIQTTINIVIPSGSAKAALTMPIMAPFSDVIGLSRQATVMAFQFGDGFTNMITPTSGVLMGALGIARIPYAMWVKWWWKFLLFLVLLGFILLIPTATMNLNGF